MIKYIDICRYVNIFSLLGWGYLVGCVIQKRILYFCFLQDGNKVDICADSGLPYGECHKGEKLEHDMEQILKSIPKGMLKTHLHIHSNLDIGNKSVKPFLFTISNNSQYRM